MDQDLFKTLPSEILLNILSIITAHSTFSCKCVCKPWLDMLMTDEFVKSHLSKSVSGLAVCQETSPLKICIFDELGVEQPTYPCKTFFNFASHVNELFYSSVNGLLLLERHPFFDFSLNNPITRDSIRIDAPPTYIEHVFHNYGFGVSKMTSQYKLVSIYNVRDPRTYRLLHQSKGHVYTVGTRRWRSIVDCGPFRYRVNSHGEFMNGNIHWLVLDSKSSARISCFDVETELFSSFVTPSPSLTSDYNEYRFTLSVLKDRLCLCDNSMEDEIVIWLMKQYGDENSWTKEFIISRTTSPDDLYGTLWVIKVFENGDLLIARQSSPKLLRYSNKTRTIRTIDLLGLSNDDGHGVTKVIIYTPSLVSLKTFTKEEF